MPQPIDDQTTAYIIEQRRHFEDLRQVAAQIAGLLVLAAAGARSVEPDRIVGAAHQAFQKAADGVRRGVPTPRARQHHDQLLRAAHALEGVLRAVRAHAGPGSAREDLDHILVPLRISWKHLQRASNLLPGFELVAFGQTCCGAVSRAGRERAPSRRGAGDHA